MNYKLDGVNISSFGAVPYVNRSQTCIAISGIFDLPKRKGTTEYNWQNSIEPYVDAEDIELDGRTLTLSLCIKAIDYQSKLDSLKAACISCRKLWTEFGEFDVVLKDEIAVEEYIAINIVIVKIKFWQQSYLLIPVIVPPTGGLSYSIDGYNLQKDFGISISSRSGLKNVGKRIEVSTTIPYTQTLYREAHDISLKCMMRAENLAQLYSRMSQFHTLCISPGMRTLRLRDNEEAILYFKDGITVVARTERLLDFSLKCRIVK